MSGDWRTCDVPHLGPGSVRKEELVRLGNEAVDRLVDALKGKLHMKATRAKMRLISISGGYYGTDKSRTVEFRPVMDGSEENKRFFSATPSGELKLCLSADAATSLGLDQGKIGSEFYVDITPVE
jgi:hypothetical protein